jgi:transcriptional regulator with PAS, ATPase and Fis domain
MISRKILLLVISNTHAVRSIFDRLQWPYCGTQNEAVADALRKAPGAVIFCAPDWTAAAALQYARRQIAERGHLEVVIFMARHEQTSIHAVRSEVVRTLDSTGGDDRAAQELFEVLRLVGADCDGDDMVGRSPVMMHVREIIRRIAPVDSTVLITGETGTGKELAARALHTMSRRRNKPYVCVNCAAIPEGLLESELFGHEKGAFTGAIAKQPGKLRAAHEGTIFLDEIGEMAPSAQSKLLRALDAREVQPLGSNERIPIDVRVIAATNQDLERLMGTQKFRPDLFFRLSVLPVNMPPLRDHVEDIPDMVSRFVGELNAKYSRAVNGVTDDGIQLLLGYSWPGNVRQLRSVIERGYLICSASWITAEDLQ